MFWFIVAAAGFLSIAAGIIITLKDERRWKRDGILVDLTNEKPVHQWGRILPDVPYDWLRDEAEAQSQGVARQSTHGTTVTQATSAGTRTDGAFVEGVAMEPFQSWRKSVEE